MKLMKHDEVANPLPTLGQFYQDCLLFGDEPTFEFEGRTYVLIDKTDSSFTKLHARPGDHFEILTAKDFYPAFNLRSRTVRGVHRNASVKPITLEVHTFPRK